MHYREIQLRLAEASRLIDAGELAEADRLIRSMLGKGMTPADLDANLGAERIRALREFSTSQAAALEARERAKSNARCALSELDLLPIVEAWAEAPEEGGADRAVEILEMLANDLGIEVTS